MKLSVIIPVYNEASTFRTLLDRVHEVPVDKEILVVDDASDHETVTQLEQAITEDVKLYTHAKNAGKGAAIRTALQYATGDVVIIQDADLEYFPEDYSSLLQAYEDHDVRAVYGVRDLGERSSLMRFGNQFLTWITNLLFGSRLHDMETCYKLIDRELLQDLGLRSRRFEIEAEITAKLLLRNVTIAEVPIRYAPREEDEGKKLSPMDGLPAVATLLKYRLHLPENVAISTIEKGIVLAAATAAAALLLLLARLLFPRRR
jgi:glycosyltransferase involved in cell wall biosynthesis